MFTGIVQSVGRIVGLTPGSSGVRLVVECPQWRHGAIRGDSICVSGCCLTVVNQPEPTGRLEFDVIPETMRLTSLGGRRVGDRVNLETSATLSTLLGGHVLQGHVEGTAEVVGIVDQGEYRLRLRPPPDLMPCITPKGSVALDGVSLTIAAVDVGEGWFEVALIPATLELTTLGELRPGGFCNVETDILARTVIHWATYYASQNRP